MTRYYAIDLLSSGHLPRTLFGVPAFVAESIGTNSHGFCLPPIRRYSSVACRTTCRSPICRNRRRMRRSITRTGAGACARRLPIAASIRPARATLANAGDGVKGANSVDLQAHVNVRPSVRLTAERINPTNTAIGSCQRRVRSPPRSYRTADLRLGVSSGSNPGTARTSSGRAAQLRCARMPPVRSSKVRSVRRPNNSPSQKPPRRRRASRSRVGRGRSNMRRRRGARGRPDFRRPDTCCPHSNTNRRASAGAR